MEAIGEGEVAGLGADFGGELRGVDEERFCGGDVQGGSAWVTVMRGRAGDHGEWGLGIRLFELAGLRVVVGDRFAEVGRLSPVGEQECEREVGKR